MKKRKKVWKVSEKSNGVLLEWETHEPNIIVEGKDIIWSAKLKEFKKSKKKP